MPISPDPSVLIIGAGPAGLAAAACLRQAGVPSAVLERSQQLGAAWHRHYDRLHLHSDKGSSSLPLMPFPRDYPRYPSRRLMVDYLHAYAQRFGIEPVLGQEVTDVRPAEAGWEVQTPDRTFRARHVVVATGLTRDPQTPSWPGQDLFQGTVLHSAAYRSGAELKGKKVLVVGYGNSGAEIALDACEHGAAVGVSVRSPVNVVPREILGIPITVMAIAQSWLPWRWLDTLNAPVLALTTGDLSRYGLRKPALGSFAQIHLHARVPVIDIGTVERIKRGEIKVYPGVDRFTSEGAVFTDGTQAPFDAVVLATGYRPGLHTFLQGAHAALRENGLPVAHGKETLPGLYFCGFRVSATGMLREINAEARRIAAAVAGGRKA